MTPRIIAFYLPQYHPTPHNNEWWGQGFTEWTNVGKAKSLFPGHYQPKVPSDLGYYDLRVPEIREQQAALAKEAGVEGFCYYHYWFEDGKEELDLPFKEVLKSGTPDYPFCLCWANESWHSKFWNIDGTIEKRTLVEQKYLGKEDNYKHFMSLLQAFKDKRYMTIDEKPIFMVYQPLKFEKAKEFINQWQDLAKENGLKGIYFTAYTLFVDKEYDAIKSLGFDAVCSCRLGETYRPITFKSKLKRYILQKLKLPRIYAYSDVIKYLIQDKEKKSSDVFPTLVPNWDHTPRSGKGGYLYNNCTPELFEKHAREVLENVSQKENPVCFLKSWNEWGEGNYMEPDLRYGKGFINALHKVIESIK